MINLKTSKKVPTINVKVDPITNIHVADARASANVSVSNDGDKTNISEISACSNVSSVEELDALKRENQVLKLVIDILHSNPLVINKYIIADDELLIEMIRLLCNADEVQLDADDLGSGCISKKTYRKVNSIYVSTAGKTLNLKYDYPSVMKNLKDLHISVKYVF
jgi:hypothetical protein